MPTKRFPVIDLAATGENILRLRQASGLTVRDVQAYFGFEEPQAIYKWQRGKSLPSVDNLYALSGLLGVPMNDILVPAEQGPDRFDRMQQAEACCSSFYGPDRSFASLPSLRRGASQWSVYHIPPGETTPEKLKPAAGHRRAAAALVCIRPFPRKSPGKPQVIPERDPPLSCRPLLFRRRFPPGRCSRDTA